MDFRSVKASIVSWVVLLAGLTPPADVVVWKNQPRPQGTGRMVVLSWVSRTTIGVDDVIWSTTTDPAPAENATPNSITQWKLVVQLSIQTNDTTDGAPNADDLSAAMMARAWGVSSIALLGAANLGLIGADQATPADYTANGRVVQRTVLTVSFNWSTVEVDTAGQGNTIDQAFVTSEVTDEAGELLPPSMQMNNEGIPPS